MLYFLLLLLLLLFCFFKACVSYFLSNFYFSPRDSPLKTVKNHENVFSSKKLFSFSNYSDFLFQSSPFFLPVRHCFRGCLKINLKVYGIINCLNTNLIAHFVWYLEKEKRYDIKTLTIDRVLNRKHFLEKSCRKCAPKASTRFLFNFGK